MLLNLVSRGGGNETKVVPPTKSTTGGVNIFKDERENHLMV